MSQRMRMFLEMANVISFLGGDITSIIRRLQVEERKRSEGIPVNEARRKETRYWKFVEMHQGEEAFVTWVTGETRSEAFLEFCRVSDRDGSPEMRSPGGVDQKLRGAGGVYLMERRQKVRNKSSDVGSVRSLALMILGSKSGGEG